MTIRLLHLDDKRTALRVTEKYFERFSETITIETTTSPEEAIEVVTDGGIDCLLCDYEMPEMDGFEVLDAIRDGGCDVPFVLYTGKGSEGFEREARAAGVTEYLEKGDGVAHLETLAGLIEAVTED